MVTSHVAGGQPSACGPRRRQEALSSTPLPAASSPATRLLSPCLTLFFFFCLEMNLNGPKEGQRLDYKNLKMLK